MKTLIIFIFEPVVAFFLYYLVWRINKWSPTLKIFLVAFIIQQLNLPNQSGILKKWLEKLINYFIYIIIWCHIHHIHYHIINPILSFFECIKCFSSTSLEEMKLIAIFNWTFHVSYFWRYIMISLRYGLIFYFKKFSYTFNCFLLIVSFHLHTQFWHILVYYNTWF